MSAFGQAGFPGCSRVISGSEIIPVRPGQGNACEGKEYKQYLSFLNSVSLLFFNRLPRQALKT